LSHFGSPNFGHLTDCLIKKSLAMATIDIEKLCKGVTFAMG
jgi:hypothetical protein